MRCRNEPLHPQMLLHINNPAFQRVRFIAMKQRCGEAMVERAEEEAMFICSDLQDTHTKPHSCSNPAEL